MARTCQVLDSVKQGCKARFPLVLFVVTAWSPAWGQFARVTPPPPCRVPLGLQGRATTRLSGDKRPFVIVEPLNAVTTERGSLHLPWALSVRLRERLSRDRRLVVATEGSEERASLESGGNADSAATLLGAEWILRGTSAAALGATEIKLELRRRGSAGSGPPGRPS